MCRALEELMEQGREQGREQGVAALIETCQEFNQSAIETKQRIMKKFSMPAEDAQKLLEKYWK